MTYAAQNFGEDKMFDFRRITPFCLGNRFSKEKLIYMSKIWGGHGLLATPMFMGAV